MNEPGAHEDWLAKQAVDSAFAVHKVLGPGLLESVYEECLCYELGVRGIDAQRQVQQPLTYKEVRLSSGYRLDLLVGGLIVVEVKAVEVLLPVHTAQLLTYLKLSRFRLGLLINFNVPLIRDGIRRLIRPA
jgi:GxxExxY protein